MQGNAMTVVTNRAAGRTGWVLMQCRDVDAPTGAGRWGLPGGMVEPGETPIEAARREVVEETGLTVTDLRPLTEFVSRSELGPLVRRYVFAGETTACQAEVVVGEGQAAVFLPPSQLGRLALTATARTVLAGCVPGIAPPVSIAEPVEAVIFDFGATLTIATSPAELAADRRQVATALGVEPEEYEQQYRQLRYRWGTGQLGDLTDAMRALAAACGVNPAAAAVTEACGVWLERHRARVRLRPGAVETLRDLGDRGYRVGLISDCAHDLPLIWPDLPISTYIQSPVFSVRVGIRKPCLDIYLIAADRLGVDTDRCLYVGNGDNDELPAAAAAGMRPIQIHSEDHERTGRTIQWDGPRIRQLADLVEHLHPARHTIVCRRTGSGSP